MSKSNTAHRLTESAVMLAFAAVLSILKILDMPYGGSVTAFSMLPLLIIAYRYGTRWGILTAFTYGIVQFFLGMDNLSYATSFGAAVAIVVFDYLLAFVVLGLGGLFRTKSLSQGASLAIAAVVTGILRYLCHTIAGCTVWAGLSVPTKEAAIYSLSYNATYMIPEIVILVLGAIYVSRLLSFENTQITRIGKAAMRTAPFVLSAVAKTVLLAGAVIIVLIVAPSLQFNDGTLFLRGLASANWLAVGITAAVALPPAVVLELVAHHLSRKN